MVTTSLSSDVISYLTNFFVILVYATNESNARLNLKTFLVIQPKTRVVVVLNETLISFHCSLAPELIRISSLLSESRSIFVLLATFLILSATSISVFLLNEVECTFTLSYSVSDISQGSKNSFVLCFSRWIITLNFKSSSFL